MCSSPGCFTCISAVVFSGQRTVAYIVCANCIVAFWAVHAMKVTYRNIDAAKHDYNYLLHSASSIFNLQPFSSSAQVSTFGGEAGFSSCSHPDRGIDEQRNKKLKK